MSEKRQNLMIILGYITVLITILVVLGTNFYIMERNNYYKQQNINMQLLAKDCLKHVQNFATSANANKIDIGSWGVLSPAQKTTQAYGLGSDPSQPSIGFIMWQANLQCMINYPTYNSNYSKDSYNFSLY